MILLLLVAGCGGSAPDPTAPLTDETLRRETHAGRLAYELERDEEALTQYRAALTRAQSRDDLEAIGDTGYNLAVAELRANAPDRALADARATQPGDFRTTKIGDTPVIVTRDLDGEIYVLGSKPPAQPHSRQLIQSEAPRQCRLAQGRPARAPGTAQQPLPTAISLSPLTPDGPPPRDRLGGADNRLSVASLNSGP